MPRALRFESPGGYFHVAARGNNRQPIFDDELRVLFLRETERAARRHEWLVLAWALMSNHFHLVIQTRTGVLSAGMCELNARFARVSNARFGRMNHCFGQRFWSTHLETDRHLLESIRYSLWNPVRAGIVDDPRDSGWTSFRESVGLEHPSGLLAHRALLEHFGSDAVPSRRAFSRYVSEGRVRCQAPWQECVDALR